MPENTRLLQEYSTYNKKCIASENLGPHQIQRIRKDSGTEQYRTSKNYKLFAVQVSKCAGALPCRTVEHQIVQVQVVRVLYTVHCTLYLVHR